MPIVGFDTSRVPRRPPTAEEAAEAAAADREAMEEQAAWYAGAPSVEAYREHLALQRKCEAERRAAEARARALVVAARRARLPRVPRRGPRRTARRSRPSHRRVVATRAGPTDDPGPGEPEAAPDPRRFPRLVDGATFIFDMREEDFGEWGQL